MWMMMSTRAARRVMRTNASGLVTAGQSWSGVASDTRRCYLDGLFLVRCAGNSVFFGDIWRCLECIVHSIPFI